jgi:hypothetical protein
VSASDGLLFQRDLFGEPVTPASGAVAKRFGIPPFTVLDARSGPWGERKQAWKQLGLRSWDGRGGNLLGMSETVQLAQQARLPHMAGRSEEVAALERAEASRKFKGFLAVDPLRGEVDYFGKKDAAPGGVSIFDPVLCELVYQWFCPPRGAILDPFAGGSVRGLVAVLLGYDYTGVEIRAEQIAANEEQAAEMLVAPRWIHGDSTRLDDVLPAGASYDMVWSCPPYYDLEEYDGGKGDGSGHATYGEFIRWYEDVFAQAAGRLRDNRMLAVLVGDIRDDAGVIRGFVPDNVAVMKRLGLHFYNEAVLLTAVGSMPIRVTRQFRGGRKLCRGHQTLLVFYKGNASNMSRRLREPPWEWPKDDVESGWPANGGEEQEAPDEEQR